MKTQVQSPAAPAAIGPYSQAIIWDRLVFCSGQIPLIPETMTLETADITLQTKRVLKNLSAVLEAAGSNPKNIVKATVFLTSLKNFEAFNKEYEAFFKTFSAGPAPARSTIEVSALPKGALVEIEAIAYRS